MDTGPREGDIFIENIYPIGSAEWHKVEANNIIYRRREAECQYVNMFGILPDGTPLSGEDKLIRKLISHYSGCSLSNLFEKL